jgi:hypothetical protein
MPHASSQNILVCYRHNVSWLVLRSTGPAASRATFLESGGRGEVGSRGGTWPTPNCNEGNNSTGERTFLVKETLLSDLRILGAGRSQRMIVNYDSRRLLVTTKNSGGLEHEKDVILQGEGYSTGARPV